MEETRQLTKGGGERNRRSEKYLSKKEDELKTNGWRLEKKIKTKKKEIT